MIWGKRYDMCLVKTAKQLFLDKSYFVVIEYVCLKLIPPCKRCLY